MSMPAVSTHADAARSRARRRMFAWTTALVGLVVATAGAEAALRFIGQTPARLIKETGRPVLHEPDPVLGWRNRPGAYFMPPYSDEGITTRFTVRTDGSRATSAVEGPSDRPLVLALGCSYAQGWAIGDEETFAWRLQDKHQRLNVRNFGSAGYSTYQTLLRLEGLYAQGLAPKIVILGFIEDQERRNVAPWWWLRFLATYSNRKHVDVPYCTLDSRGALVRHDAQRYQMFPMRESLAVVPALERGYMQLLTHGRAAQGRAVTEKLIVEMESLTRSHGSQLLVALLAASKEAHAHYASFLKSQGIRMVDCAFEETPDMRVKRDGHPNGLMNSRYASCIDTELAGMAAPYEDGR